MRTAIHLSLTVDVYSVRTVAELFIAEHGRDWVVADVVADSEAAEKQLDGEVLVDAVVEQDAVTLAGRQQDRDVAVRSMRQRW